ncbi:MAG: sodium/proton-translocating pyrophosphatase, partial [Candidatus Brockarchaeota archaeon]|nr:sodium/proton-translocating pyrophosphatase [Candidatus Brockarchaeota archaeon]
MDTLDFPIAPETLVSASVLVSLIAIVILMLQVLKHRVRNHQATRIASYIETGASAFLRTEYSVIMVFDIAVTLLLLILLGFKAAVAFILGATLSLASGFMGMKIAVKSNARTMESTNEGVFKGLRMALSGGSVMGLSVASLS